MSPRPQVFGNPRPWFERKANGTIYVHAKKKLPKPAPSMNERLHYWAAKKPDAIFLAQRDSNLIWRRVSYAEALDKVRRIAAALLKRKLSSKRPVMILSANGIEHALLGLACMEIGVPYAPISTAYSLISQDFGKLKYAIELLQPGLVFANEGRVFARALKTAVPAGIEIVVGDGSESDFDGTSFASLASAEHNPKTDRLMKALKRGTIAKFLLTSGSTGLPKAVINTVGMLTANQVMLRESLPFLKAQAPVILDWLPWSHTFGGNHNFGVVLYNGGTFYIDDGRPVPGGVEATVRNLREISPTVYFNVPRGYEMLLPYLEKDEALRRKFFSKLSLLFYSGAGMPKAIWDKIAALGRKTTRRSIPMTTGLGSTETAPACITCVREVEGPGNVGLPMPGVTLKLVPNGGKMEVRMRGPNIMSGYWKRRDLTKAAFDRQGFYKIGDALKFVNPKKPELGFVFDGRIAEDFKLVTGTWVSVGPLRTALVSACSPLIKDIAIAGHDRNFIAGLIIPDFEALRKHAHNASGSHHELSRDAGVLSILNARLEGFAKSATGSSNRLERAILLSAPPSIDRGEITDKGSLNQRAVLGNNAEAIASVYAVEPEAHVIIVGGKA